MSKTKIHVIIVSWKAPEVILASVKSLIESKSDITDFSVVLNEGDYLSAAGLAKAKVKFISTPYNFGALGIDFNIPFIDPKTTYVMLSNNDFIYCPSWEKELLDELETGTIPSSCSMPLVENTFFGHPQVVEHKIVENVERDFALIQEPFWEAWNNGRYVFKKKITWNHPQTLLYQDYLDIGGLSDSMNMKFFPGHWLDDVAAFNLWKKYNGNFQFKTTTKACVYHGQSLGMSKNPVKVPEQVFIDRTGMRASEFKRITRQYEEY